MERLLREHQQTCQVSTADLWSLCMHARALGLYAHGCALMRPGHTFLQMAVEVLYAMLGRDRDVRASVAQHGGLKDLVTLSRVCKGPALQRCHGCRCRQLGQAAVLALALALLLSMQQL